MDSDFAKAVLCEAQLMRDAAGMANELRTMNTKVRGKYAVQEQKVVRGGALCTSDGDVRS